MIIEEDVCSRVDLVAISRTHLRWLFGEGPVVSPDILLEPAFPRVNVTLRSKGQIRGSMSGHGGTLREQLLDAVYRSSRDSRFTGSIVKADLGRVSIEVWLQCLSEPIPVEARESPDAIRLGEDGVEVRLGPKFAYYKPSVAITQNLSSAQIVFGGVCKKARLPEDAWREPSCDLRRTSWIHLCETSDQGVVQMKTLRRIAPPTITASTLVEWAYEGANYFKANQYSNGSFCYKYRPFSNDEKKESANAVRASGCAYAIAVAASSPHFSHDQKILECADRAVVDILCRSTPFMDDGCYIADNKVGENGKLGTTALLLLALMTPLLRQKYKDQIASLITAVKSAQSDEGLFKCSFGNGDDSGSQINFFPGQAILSLIMKAEIGDESCKEYYRMAFTSYRDHFRKSPSTAFVGWHADAWSRAALLDGNPEYVAFVFEQIDWLLKFQLTDESQLLNYGGFSWNGKPPGYSSIVYTEAIARGARLALTGDQSRWERYRKAFQAGIGFCSKLRLTKDQAIFFPSPMRAIGGVAMSLSNFEVRADVVQHALTLVLTALDLPDLLD